MTPSRPLFALILATLATAARAGDLPPVDAGLWEIQALTTTEPRPDSASMPRPRSYRICIDRERARSPMVPARLPGAGELLIGHQSLSGNYVETGPDGVSQQVEFRYRRLGAASFEGSYDRVGGGLTLHTEYYARRLDADCGAIEPTPLQSVGLP